MGVSSACLTAIAAGAVTVGVTANVMAVPQSQTPAPRSSNVRLTANAAIPIIDFDRTVGPLTLVRQLSAVFGSTPNASTAALEGFSQDVWRGLLVPFGVVTNSLSLPVGRHLTPGQLEDIGFDPAANSDIQINAIDGSRLDVTSRAASGLHVIRYLGGAEGSGLGLTGDLFRGAFHSGIDAHEFTLDSDSDVGIGSHSSQLTVLPGGGVKAIVNATPAVANSQTRVRLKDGVLSTDIGGYAGGGDALCLGSAAASCGAIANSITSAGFHASVRYERPNGHSVTVLDAEFPDLVNAAVTSDRISVTGTLGGTVRVGQVTLGRTVPLNVQIPRLSSLANKQSFKAVPGNSVANNAAGGKHRATPLKDAVDTIKKAVDNVTHPKHAKAD
jgi:hypothetical protein